MIYYKNTFFLKKILKENNIQELISTKFYWSLDLWQGTKSVRRVVKDHAHVRVSDNYILFNWTYGGIRPLFMSDGRLRRLQLHRNYSTN